MTNPTRDSFETLYMSGVGHARLKVSRPVDGSMDYEAGIEELRRTWLAISRRVEELSAVDPISDRDLRYVSDLLSGIESLADQWQRENTLSRGPQRDPKTDGGDLARRQGVGADPRLTDESIATSPAPSTALPRARDSELPRKRRRSFGSPTPSERVGNLIYLMLYLPMLGLSLILWVATLGLGSIVTMFLLGPIAEQWEGLTGRDAVAIGRFMEWFAFWKAFVIAVVLLAGMYAIAYGLSQAGYDTWSAGPLGWQRSA